MSSPASSSARQPLSGWRALAAATAVIGTTSLAITYARYRMRRALLLGDEKGTPTGTDDMPALEPVPSSAAAAAAPASAQKKAPRAAPRTSSKPVVVPHTWSEQEFGMTAQTFLEALGQHNQADAHVEANLRAALTQVLKFSNEARALASHFLLATNAHYLTQSTSEEEFDSLMVKQAEDMKLAWKLLDCPEASPDQSRALDVMRMQVATCLKDAPLMLPLFERMTSRSIEEFNDEELILLFTTAPLLGRWASTVALGDRLATMHDLNDFHNAPMDYQILYELAKVEQAKGDVVVEQLQWKNFKIVMQRIQLRHAECDDKQMLASLEAEFSHEGRRTWKVLPVHESLRLVRCGALSQLRSFSPVPLALVGPSDDKRIYAQGYADIQASKQTETYDLVYVPQSSLDGGESDDDVPQDALHLQGTYTMVQEPANDEAANGMPILKVVFDFEMSIVRM